jgi:uncharacterized delta-60 repeat protein
VLVSASLLATASAQAAPGDFDTTFSGDGKELTDFGKSDSASGVVLQPDGKIVVAGSSGLEVTQCGDDGCVSESQADSALARYNGDGTLDTSFSGDGKDATDFGAASDVALQPDGKLVVVGTEGFKRCFDIWCDSFAEFAVARYNTDGTLDTSFSGDGKETTDFGKTDSASGVVLQPDGKIVVAGSSVDPSGNGADDFALARYNADGALDTSFSDDGRQVTDFGGSDKGAYGLALQPDGKIVAVGRTSYDDFALARYGVDGSLDNTFSGDGKQTTDLDGWDEGKAVTIQADHKIVVAGTTNRGAFVGDDDFALARYNADGSLDTTFSGDGKQNTNFGTRYHDSASGIALQPDGKIIAAGHSTGEGDTGFALVRYSGDGSLDTSFSSDGRQHTGFGAAASDVALQLDGKIVAAGSGDGDFALARYQGGSASSPPGGSAPTNSSPPAISGSAIEGEAVTVELPGTWTGSTPIERSYQWRRCDSAGANCADIPAATAPAYTLTAADVGRTIRVRETATNVHGTGSADSAATGVVRTKPGVIAGTVRSKNNNAGIPSARVRCGAGYSTTTTTDGSYSIPNVAPGTYSCTASASGYRPSTQSVTVPTSGGTVTANFSLRR